MKPNRERVVLSAVLALASGLSSVSFLAGPTPGLLRAHSASGTAEPVELERRSLERYGPLESTTAWMFDESGFGEREVVGDVISPELARASSIRLLRWPDRAPLVGVDVSVLEQTTRIRIDSVSRIGGRVRLADSLRGREARLVVRAEGFERKHQTIDVPEEGRSTHVVLLRPTRGWYGRVVDFEGAPVARAWVAGWWVESARPTRVATRNGVVGEDVLAARASLGLAVADPTPPAPELPDEGDDSEDVEEEPPRPPDFFAGKGLIEAVKTNDDGWYYVPPLAGPVLGQLTLLAREESVSSDVLRVELPGEGLEVPAIMLHKAKQQHGVVLDTGGAPVPGATILVQLADGWSPILETLTTDEKGRFAFNAPVADLALAVEKARYQLINPALHKPESADRLWDDLHSIAPAGSNPGELFEEAYVRWTAPLPRALACVRANPWGGEARLVVERVGRLELEVRDAKKGRRIAGAGVRSSYGGIDEGRQITSTDKDGRAFVDLVDRAWQPQLLQVRSEGYEPVLLALPPGPIDSPLRITLRGAGSADPRDARGGLQGLALGTDGSPLPARIAIYLRHGSRRWLHWSGLADADGLFWFDLPDDLPRTTVMEICGAGMRGGELRGAMLDALSPSDVALRGGVTLHLGRGTEMRIATHGIEKGCRYRVRWEMSPFPDVPSLANGVFDIPREAVGYHEERLPVFEGWKVRAVVYGATIGHAPTLEFTRGTEEGRPFPSTRIAWSDWVSMSPEVEVVATAHGGRLSLAVERRVPVSGSVEGLPRLAVPNTVQVAAMGKDGTWIAAVDGNGWFEFVPLPPGTYRFVVYVRPSPLDVAFELENAGELVGGALVDCHRPRHDLELTWSGSE